MLTLTSFTVRPLSVTIEPATEAVAVLHVPLLSVTVNVIVTNSSFILVMM